MLLLLSHAFAYQCTPMRRVSSGPQVDASTLGSEEGALYVTWLNAPEDAAARFRLRDPAGALVPWQAHALRDVRRFDPTVELPAGTYQLEHLHQYVQGSYEPQPGKPGGTWYPVERFEVGRDGSIDWTQPVTSTFTRMPSAVRLEASLPPSTTRYAIEVDGVGEVISAPAPRGRVEVFLQRFGPCVKAYDLRDDDRFRVVAYGPEGRLATGAWSQASYDPELEKKYARSLEVVESKDRVSWKQEPVSTDTRPPSTRVTACGMPSLAETERKRLPEGRHRHVPDSDGVLHSITLYRGGVVLDGVTHEVDGGFEDVPLGHSVVRGSGRDLWLELAVERSHTTFLRIQDGELTERHRRNGFPIHFWPIEDGVRIRTYTADGRHVLETLRSGEIEREEVTWPPTVGDGTVNGRRLQLPNGQTILEFGHAEGSVFVASVGENDHNPTLGRYDLEGRPIWTVALEDPEPVHGIGLGEGVVCAQERCFDLATGAPAAYRSAERLPRLELGSHIPDPDAVSPPRQGQPATSRLPEGTLERTSMGLIVRGRDGRTTPALRTFQMPYRELPEAVELRWFEGDEEVVAQVTCGESAVRFFPYER